MKYINFFLILSVLFCGCQKQEEDAFDLDQMVLAEDELNANSHIAREALTSPQEILVQEPLEIDEFEE